MSNPPCPYCGEELHLNPKSAAKCKACGNKVRVRSKQEIFDHHPLTESEARAADSFRNLAEYGIRPADFREHRSLLEERFGSPPPAGDVIWSLWQEALRRTPENRRHIYYQMALYLNREGRDYTHVRRQHAKEELLDYKRTGFVEKVEISAAGNGCSLCQELDGQVYTIDQALEEMPLPNPACTHTLGDPERGFCRCTYLAADIGGDLESYQANRTTSSGCTAIVILVAGSAGLLLFTALTIA